jgi:hypothetical protein
MHVRINCRYNSHLTAPHRTSPHLTASLLLTLTHYLLPSSLHHIPLSLDHSPYKNNYNRLHCIALPCLALPCHSFIREEEEEEEGIELTVLFTYRTHHCTAPRSRAHRYQARSLSLAYCTITS